ncbi:ribosomal protein S14p/S29e [Bacteriovorax sp. BSW11_IV]|uniref:30S ribosomal protein S14 n=1 Tax=Bacteriovorax sp. BSW11_IV TaxID=1353529 RepID=UPI00038A4A78|nr:30S ribosomal protein S14 [Bacteriovorax sp. BSW11_IV]EQC48808.1 ribosomal protein S14p/S29e [Bacteriovorax sp. BSW11_IV]
MARKAKVESNKRRAKLAAKYAPLRAELSKTIKDVNASDEQKFEAQMKLQKLPRNSSKIRVRNLCNLTGRSRAYYRKFGLSRVALRELGLKGLIPGLTKSSW